MASLRQQFLLGGYILFSAAILTIAVPFDRLSSGDYTKQSVTSDSENVCMIDDVLYQVGDAIPTASPCEKCVCRPPGFACSIITCEKRPNCRALQRSNQCCPEYKCDCEHEGKIYHNGEKLDNIENPCKVCYCQGGEVACTVIECYKRDDCVPTHVPGMCCPKYDNCPPRDPSRSVQPANMTAAKEAPKFREVADERLNLVGEPDTMNHSLQEKPISNNIYDQPQGDDSHVYDAYDDSSTSTSPIGDDIIYEEVSSSTSLSSSSSTTTAGTTSSSTFSTESTAVVSSSSTSSSSYFTDSSTEISSLWTNIPTFPTDWKTTVSEWQTSTSNTSQDGSTEYFPTWGTDYSTQTIMPSKDDSSTAVTTSTDSTPSSTTVNTDSTPSSTTVNTGSTPSSTTVNTDSTPSSTTVNTPYYITDTSLSTTTLSSTSQSSDGSTASFSNNTFSTSPPSIYHQTNNISTANSIFSSTSTDITTLLQDGTSASGDGETNPQTSNCIDGNEDCDQSGTDFMTILTEFINSTQEPSSIDIEFNTDTSVESIAHTNDDETSTTQENSSTSKTENGENTEASTRDITESQGTTEVDNSTEMAQDMPQPNHEDKEFSLETDIWGESDTSTVQADTKILPDILNLKSDKTMENIRVSSSDFNDTADANSNVDIQQKWLKKTEDMAASNTEESSTSTDDSFAVVTTKSDTFVSTEGNDYETRAIVKYRSSSANTESETTVTESATLSTNTETSGSSFSETFSTSESSQTTSQSTETITDSTTTEVNS